MRAVAVPILADGMNPVAGGAAVLAYLVGVPLVAGLVAWSALRGVLRLAGRPGAVRLGRVVGVLAVLWVAVLAKVVWWR